MKSPRDISEEFYAGSVTGVMMIHAFTVAVNTEVLRHVIKLIVKQL